MEASSFHKFKLHASPIGSMEFLNTINMFRYKFLVSILSLFLVVTLTRGQNEDNALNYSYDRPTGTARSIALGGAMGALGGDYSAIGINPAGIAVYRSSEFSFTPSLIFNTTESDYYGTVSSDDKFSVPFNQISYVGTSRLMRENIDGIVSTHFGIGYNRTNNYNRKSYIQGNEVPSTLLDKFVYDANQGKWHPNYNDFAYQIFLLDEDPDFPGSYMHGFEYIDSDEEAPQWGPVDGINQTSVISEKGNSGEFNLSFGANFANKIQLGASLGITTLSYQSNWAHREEVAVTETPSGIRDYYSEYLSFRGEMGWQYLDYFEFEEEIDTHGTGINFDIGAIFRITNSLRLGAAFHSPTFYSFKDEYSTDIYANYYSIEQTGENEFNLHPAEPGQLDEPRYGEFSYNFRTPYKLIGSIAYIFGNKGLISIDYEFSDYSKMKYKSKNNDIDDINDLNEINDAIGNTFKATHNIRIGAEYKITPLIYVRGGFANYQNPYKKPINISENNEQFERIKNNFSISGGFGFRLKDMTVDITYLNHNQHLAKRIYYSSDVADVDQYPVEFKSTDHQLAVTLGWRF
jgi:long-subunit fatty acid transport protein